MKNVLTTAGELLGIGVVAVGLGMIALPLGVIGAGAGLFAVAYIVGGDG